MFFEGRDITHSDGVATTKAGIIQVPGGKAVFPTLTVAEHLRAGGWLYRDDPKYLEGAVAEVYRIFPRLDERRDQLAGNLSGGEQQMLALGMAFIAKPKLLMIDELSLGLAPTIVEMLLGIVRRIQDSGTAIILVEQSINVALTVADRAYFMEKGEVRFEGSTAELLERDDIVRSVFLEGAAKTNGNEKAAAPTTVAASARAAELAEKPVVLDVRAIIKTFGGIRAVDDASFTLREGEILGLIGPNGAGKTTIFDLISGFLIPDRGRVLLGDIDVTKMSPDRRAWLRLGRSFQDARLVPSLTVAENIALGFERHLDVRDHVAAMLGLPGVVELEEHVAWSVNDLIELMGLGAFRDKFVRELSTGSRRIVDLAMCIAHDPRVLLLDEPSSGIAQRETEALGPLLRRIQAETGCALLIIEHDMPLITSISDRMIALELGHPIVEGTPEEVIRNPRGVFVSRGRHGHDQPIRSDQRGRGGHIGRRREGSTARTAGRVAKGRGMTIRVRRNFARCAGLGLVAISLLLLASAGSAGADGSATKFVAQGWWWEANPAKLPADPPPPPNVSKDQLWIQGSPAGGGAQGQTAFAAIRYAVDKSQVVKTLTLKVGANGDSAGSSAVLLACQTGSSWVPAQEGKWEVAPIVNPNSCVNGTRSADGTSWTFAAGTLQTGEVLDICLVPGPDPNTKAASTFSLVFDPPNDASLATATGSAPPPTTPAPTNFGTTPSGATNPAPSGSTGGSFHPAATVTPVAPALPSDKVGQTPTAPAKQQASQGALDAQLASAAPAKDRNKTPGLHRARTRGRDRAVRVAPGQLDGDERRLVAGCTRGNRRVGSVRSCPPRSAPGTDVAR